MVYLKKEDPHGSEVCQTKGSQEVTMSHETCLKSLPFWYENLDRGASWEKHVIGEMEAIGAHYEKRVWTLLKI
jgi:hypothetical protein